MLKRSLLASVVVLMVFQWACLSAIAQQRRPAQRGGQGEQNLIQIAANESVQKEIGASEEQRTQLAELKKRLVEAQKEAMPESPFGKGQIPNLGAIEQFNVNTVNALRTTAHEFEPELANILAAEQMKRVGEILVQTRGVAGLRESETAKALELTDDQKRKLGEIEQTYQKKFRRLRPGEIIQFTEGGESPLQKTRDADALAVLTAGQAQQFKEMKGKEFDVSTLENGFGGEVFVGGR
jgi:Spy/CpxP family protein refolding chaperone